MTGRGTRTLYKANRLFSVFSSRSIRFLDGGGAGGMAGPPMDTGAGVGGPSGPEVADAAGGRRSAAAARSARNRSNSVLVIDSCPVAGSTG